MYHPNRNHRKLGPELRMCVIQVMPITAAWRTSLTATNVQALEVNGHTANESGCRQRSLWRWTSAYGSGIDGLPLYTPCRIADEYSYSVGYTAGSKAIHLQSGAEHLRLQRRNGAHDRADGHGAIATCSSGPCPGTPAQGYCDSGATEVFYNPNATSCTASGSCTYTFDGNSNGYAVFAWQQSRATISLAGVTRPACMSDALVASGNSERRRPPYTNYEGGTVTESYQNIVQDIMDATSNFCQWSEGQPGCRERLCTRLSRTVTTPEPGRRLVVQLRGRGTTTPCRSGQSIGLIAGERGFRPDYPADRQGCQQHVGDRRPGCAEQGADRRRFMGLRRRQLTTTHRATITAP
jgi:hypothetical protein